MFSSVKHSNQVEREVSQLVLLKALTERFDYISHLERCDSCL